MENTKPLNINEIMVSPNVAPKLEEDYLTYVGSKVVHEFDKDKASRREWEDLINKALELSKLTYKEKDYPWPKASNVKYPLISNAVIQFAARTVPEIVRGDKVVEAAVIGRATEEKEQRARRIAKHMSYQLLIESDEWEESVDKLITVMANVGIAHKKTFYDPIRQRNVSELLTHDEFVVNRDIPSLEEARRATHVLHYHANDILAYIRSGLYVDLEMDELSASGVYTDGDLYKDDEENYHEILEQHCYLDLDGDNYEEPYIVTVHRDSGKVLRIVARFDPEGIEKNEDDEIIHIEPVHYFTDFHFLPAMDGSYYSLGFGPLLYSLNETVNTTVNQLIDAGTLANLQGGFIGKGMRVRGGIMHHRPGEWKQLDSAVGSDIARNIVPLQYHEPSGTLFQLMGHIVDATKEFSSITEVMSGNQPAQNVPATTILSLIEQGLKVFSSIQKRLHHSLKKEFAKLYRLNRIFLDPEVYYRTMDEDGIIFQKDYEDFELDIKPVSDPRMSSDAQRLARSQALMQLVSSKIEGLNHQEILVRYLRDLEVPNIEKLVTAPDQQKPSPEMIKSQIDQSKIQGELAIKMKEIQLKEDELNLRIMKETEELKYQRERAMAEIGEIKARSIDALARAEAAEAGQQLEIYKTALESLKEQSSIQKELNSEEYNRNVGGMQDVDAALANLGAPEATPAGGPVDNRILDQAPSESESA